ncbi:MAG: phosphoribosyltransferase family protein [Christensenellales bacterium]|jgi:ribose-phosphate pyrophosphokinase
MKINNANFKVRRYSSGELKLLKADFAGILKQDEINIFYNQDEISLFELILLIKYFNDNNKKVNLILTYLPYQRMNHDNNKEIATLNFVVSLLESLNLNSLKIVEPHTLINLKNTKTENVFLGKILHALLLKKQPSLTNANIFFTDKGGVERNKGLSNNFLYGKKTRDEFGFINSYEVVGQLTSKSVIIIDDIISSGDTIIEAIDALEKLGANEFYIVAPHFEKNKFNKRLFQRPNVKKILTTNTLTKRSSHKKLEILPVWSVLNHKKSVDLTKEIT